MLRPTRHGISSRALQRILDLSRRFPGHAIYAIVADIADAFHHVPVHADHASAFGGKLPRSNHSIVSGMAVFGWTASAGFFAVFGKAVRHYQCTGASIVLGYSEPFWAFQWVDDIVFVEVDIGDRLQKAEQRLRDGVKLVFGSDGWHEGKFTTWSRKFHAVGIDWNIPDEFITVPQRKVEKMRKILTEASSRKFVSMMKLDSLVGILRHVISFIPITKPFIQRLVAVQTACRRRHKAGVPMSAFLQKDMHWWRDLVFQNEFAGVPMELFDRKPHIDDVWLLQRHQQGLRMTTMVLRERVEIAQRDAPVNDTLVARILTMATEAWGETAVAKGTLGRYSKNFKFWESFCNDFGFPVTGNKFQTFDVKMATGAFAHKAVRNAKLDYRDPEFELIAQGYKRANSHVDQKQPVTTPMLLKMRRQLNLANERDGLLWGSIVLAYFFLNRSSELWGPVSLDRSTGTTRTHCVKAHNVILRYESGNQVDASASEAHSVEILFESHKGDRIAQGTTVRHYRSEHSAVCPVVAAQQCLRIRAKWIAEKVALGPYLTSVSRTSTIEKNVVAKLIKDAARRMALSPKDFSCHSLRNGGACALLASGKSVLVIRMVLTRAQAAAQAAMQNQDVFEEEAVGGSSDEVAVMQVSDTMALVPARSAAMEIVPEVERNLANVAEQFIAQMQTLAGEHVVLKNQQEGVSQEQHAALVAVQGYAESGMKELSIQQLAIAERFQEGLRATQFAVQEQLQHMEKLQVESRAQIEGAVGEKLAQTLVEVRRASQSALAAHADGASQLEKQMHTKMEAGFEELIAHLGQLVKEQLSE
ncbi:hypothetical protein BBJ28_00016058, partial [Nothophytophthora sp. Chile5]